MSTHSRSIPGVIGDAYLCNESAIFNLIRERAVSAGVRFKKASDIALDFPLIALKEILEKRQVPVRKNVHCFQYLEASRPGVFYLHDFFDIQPIRNFILHETVHVLANTAIGDLDEHSAFVHEKDKNLFRFLVAESCANSIEVLFAWESSSDALRSFLCFMNSYSYPRKRQAQGLRFIERWGLGNAFRLLVLMHLYANYLHEAVPSKDFEMILKIARIQGISTTEKKYLNGIVFALNPRFRLTTARMFLRFCGFPRNIFPYFSKSIRKILMEDQFGERLVGSLSRMIEGDVSDGKRG